MDNKLKLEYRNYFLKSSDFNKVTTCERVRFSLKAIVLFLSFRQCQLSIGKFLLSCFLVP